MNYSKIKTLDVANGLGIRVSLFVSGCRNHCKGCFNACTWDFNYGEPFDSTTICNILTELQKPHISGLSILGGDPMEEENQEGIIVLIRYVKERFRRLKLNRDIWLWTGYDLEKLLTGTEKHTQYTNEILANVDVVIDGRFIESQKNLALSFRGSENQRIWKKENGKFVIDKKLMDYRGF